MTRDTYINASLVCECVCEPLELNKGETSQTLNASARDLAPSVSILLSDRFSV